MEKDIVAPKSWEDLVSSFEEDLLRKGRSENCSAAYVLTIKQFATFCSKNGRHEKPRVFRLQEKDLNEFFEYLKVSRCLSQNSLNRSISALKAFSVYLLEKEWNRKDIAKDLRRSVVPVKTNYKRITAKEIQKMQESVKLNFRYGLRDLVIMQLFLRCGLLVNEVAALSCDDVILSANKSFIRVHSGKNGAYREVPVKAPLRNLLERYLSTRGTTERGEPLFLSNRGVRISMQSLKYIAKKYLCLAGRPDLTPSDLRHNFALTTYEKTNDLHLVKELLGHKNISTTSRYLEVQTSK